MDFKTGDILLFDDNTSHISLYNISSVLIKYFTNSKYTHCGMILKDPLNYKGLYLWESTISNIADIEDQKKKIGVTLVPLEEYIQKYDGQIYYRKLVSSKTISPNTINQIHTLVYNKPYDIIPIDWIEAIFQRDPCPQKANRFWCSALLGFILVKMGFLSTSVDWSILRPCDFSSNSNSLKYINSFYCKELQIK